MSSHEQLPNKALQVAQELYVLELAQLLYSLSELSSDVGTLISSGAPQDEVAQHFGYLDTNIKALHESVASQAVSQ